MKGFVFKFNCALIIYEAAKVHLCSLNLLVKEISIIHSTDNNGSFTLKLGLKICNSCDTLTVCDKCL